MLRSAALAFKPTFRPCSQHFSVPSRILRGEEQAMDAKTLTRSNSTQRYGRNRAVFVGAFGRRGNLHLLPQHLRNRLYLSTLADSSAASSTLPCPNTQISHTGGGEGAQALGAPSFPHTDSLTCPVSFLLLQNPQIPEENLTQALEVVQKHFVGADIDMSELGTLPTQTQCTPSATPRTYPIVLPPGDLYLASIKRGS